MAAALVGLIIGLPVGLGIGLGGGFIAISFIGPFLVAVAIAINGKLRVKEDCQRYHYELIQAIGEAEICLEEWQGQASEKCRQKVASSEARYKEEIARNRDKFQPLFEKAHQLVDEFTMKAGLLGAAWME